jgi:Cu2+-exporting ATPase
MGPPGKASDASGDALIVRVGVTVALAMNAMMFGIAQYFGLTEEPLRTTVATLEVILSLAAVAVAAPVFFRAAWEGLCRGVLHLDLPIAVGLALSLLGTLVAFARTGDPSFADTLAVFVALMLVGRMIERGALERNRHRLLASEGADGLFARVREDDERTRVVPADGGGGAPTATVAAAEDETEATEEAPPPRAPPSALPTAGGSGASPATRRERLAPLLDIRKSGGLSSGRDSEE